MASAIIAVAALIAVIAYFLRRGPSTLALVEKAASNRDIAPILSAGAPLSGPKRKVLYANLIQFLWSNWQRGLAVQLIKVFATEFSEESISQYWIQQALTVEPGLAGAAFDAPFLDAYFRPEEAKKCGSGCGGCH